MPSLPFLKFTSYLCKLGVQRLDKNKLAQLAGKILCPMPKMLVFLASFRQELLHIGFFLYSKLSLVAEAGGVSVYQPGKQGVCGVYHATALICI